MVNGLAKHTKKLEFLLLTIQEKSYIKLYYKQN
jgi:hypothetical protein